MVSELHDNFPDDPVFLETDDRELISMLSKVVHQIMDLVAHRVALLFHVGLGATQEAGGDSFAQVILYSHDHIPIDSLFVDASMVQFIVLGQLVESEEQLATLVALEPTKN